MSNFRQKFLENEKKLIVNATGEEKKLSLFLIGEQLKSKVVNDKYLIILFLIFFPSLVYSFFNYNTHNEHEIVYRMQI